MTPEQTLENLKSFVQAEHEAGQQKLVETWQKPLPTKLQSGVTQLIKKIKIEDKHNLILTLGDRNSRFREGDMICLHQGDALDAPFVRQATIEAEYDGEWLVRAFDFNADKVREVVGDCYADPDGMDLKPFFDTALSDIASSKIGMEVILPLLGGQLDAGHIYADNYDDAADYAEEQGLNEDQIDATGKGVAAQYLTCIQGPPGTGKTKVISLIAKLLVDDGRCVLLTSHTHMAINNALNQIKKQGVPVIKVGAAGCTKGLNEGVRRFDQGSDWEDRPDRGYVIGATPFATCTSRLENFEFDTVIFDEASQVTVPLAVMAMRKARRYVFVGDHKQLPPVVLSKSVLDDNCYSVFSQLIAGNEKTSVRLTQTYRLNHDLSRWPSQQYYENRLESVGANSKRMFTLSKPDKHADVLSKEHSFVYLKSPGINSKGDSEEEANLVVDIVCTALDAGLPPEEIGIVTPYRNKAKRIRNGLTAKLGMHTAKKIVADTVERMQGQEREMVILSLCSTDLQFLQAVAAFFFQPERLNVAITRPMTKLILIGPELPPDFLNADPMNKSQNKNLIKNVEAYRSLIHSAYHVD
ncbi:MAG: AAA family ATPase [Pseudomonadales bacterium]|nr:AAA family ATPase [Pseudomonadales bacterium]